MATGRPLPRSLDPLPDESLPGYILRLAHRLDATPARILALTLSSADGLQHPCRSSHEMMVKLDSAVNNGFAAVTRLTHSEVDALTLGSLTTRYPMPAESARGQRYGSLRGHRSWWLLTNATRYCPDCLAGDSTAVQRSHGGSWRRTWRLPISFACTRHRLLLRHTCPDCERPVHGHHRSGERVALIAGPRLHGLHPAQCRWSVSRSDRGLPDCGARLDTASAQKLTGHALELQQRFDDILRQATTTPVLSAGEPTDSLRYFTDLRLLNHLVFHSWQRARQILPVTPFTAAVDEHTERLTREPSEDPVTAWRPLDPAVSAGLLTIADHSLTRPSPAEARQLLTELLPAASRRRSAFLQHFLTTEQECSPGLREAVRPITIRWRRRPATQTRAAELRVDYGPQHIPARLPADLLNRHMRSRTGDTMPSNYVAPITAIHLLQQINGGSLGDAADYLGFPTTRDARNFRTHPLCAFARRWARKHGGIHEFEMAITALANEFGQQNPLIDYRHRRLALQDWTIPADHWHTLTESTPQLRTENYHKIATAIVWCHTTSGEIRYAPASLTPGPPIRPKWLKTPPWARHPGTENPSEPRSHLAAALLTYATELTAEIDTTQKPPTHTPGR
jgi:hypothetical protein